ncbi:TIGR03943 family putative permease subunit [Lacrimispora sp.]|jgi:putative membrane protein|uniref:TIGR03943 family putative permease subunit n=1 Tax=Lacrimispora sp. TaxID=2719234 RepID=UPI0028B160A8|nr:TIGR03943 family protein [Lacrimispora sp.]
MRLRGKGMNLEALVESLCYFIFGVMLLRLTLTGAYLSYVTPRMKPYLIGLSALMLFWAVVNGKNIVRPKYKSRVKRCLVLIIPILLLAVPPSSLAAGAMVKGVSGSNLTAPSGGSVNKPEETVQSPEEYAYYTQDDLEKQDQALEESQDQEVATSSDNQARALPPGLNGLDQEAKTITISDEDFSPWVTEFGTNPEKYDGYTVIMKGFVYLDLEEKKENEFALVRLSMWCCSADLSPMGLITEYKGSLTAKENDWITVTGTLKVEDGYATLNAEKMETAEKPLEEYVYPFY